MNNGDVRKLKEEYNKLLEKKKNKSKEELLSKAILNLEISSIDSNKIMVYCGSYIVEKIHPNLVKEYLTYDDNLNATYKLYIDIETHDMYKVSLDKTIEFEEKYIVIKRKTKYNNYQDYDKIYEKVRNEFFSEIINGSSQSKSIKKILDHKKNNLSI